ncbi:hypothetical protein G7034_09805, partial [Psychroflexus sp. C1]|nr:hypothetical protein [Psychroflexus maritimus]
TTSNNGIEGEWTPELNSSNSIYTFTPNSDECAESIDIEIEIIPDITPEFSIPTEVCEDELQELPTTSDNGIEGEWQPDFNPSTTETYTFIPENEACYSELVEITIEINSLSVNLDIGPIEACDNNNDGFFHEFDLDVLIDDINFTDNPELEVSFHPTIQDAESGQN